MITRDKSHIGSSLDELLDGFTDSLAKRIRETNGGKKGELALDKLATVLFLEAIVIRLHLFEIFTIEVTESDGEGLEASGLLLR